MVSTLPRVNTRISENLKAKLQYIAEYNCRSVSQEIRMILIWHIKKFEQKHGTIEARSKE